LKLRVSALVRKRAISYWSMSWGSAVKTDILVALV
jgi:hypothetical protein